MGTILELSIVIVEYCQDPHASPVPSPPNHLLVTRCTSSFVVACHDFAGAFLVLREATDPPRKRREAGRPEGAILLSMSGESRGKALTPS